MTETTEKKPATKAAASKVPHVYTALATVMREISVEKNGMLPPNMGGKPYISAVDLAYATKTLFDANNLVLIPNETVTHDEVFNDNGRKTRTLTIQGVYKVVSTVDGSSETISGTGDGLSTGSSVASNIASTNALKNALLRTFLVTEQSVEDAGKTPQKEAPASAANTPQKANVNVLKAKVSELLGTRDRTEITKAGDQFFGGKPGWVDAPEALQKWIAHLESNK